MKRFFRRKSTYIIGIPLVIIIAVFGGAFIYTHVINPPASKVGFSDISTTTGPKGSTTTLSPAQLDGAWKPTNASVVQYLVPEILFGQSTKADGTTNAVTGSLTIAGTTVPKAAFTVDLTTVHSNQARRDAQFQGRIMNTSQFPTATFTLTKPIAFGSVPAENKTITATAAGNLMLHGTTKSVTFDVKARRVGNTVEVTGTIPVHFADYGIPNPTFGPAQVGNNGDLAFALAFEKA
ncbi:MAG TPA: YceI family protein [Acidimicrobiia bacterium]|jgi:polyisoprenoid-binding protein YceI